ncbi:hypothetical protein FB107DRAFT_263071 [Schizophyllum commune]
MSSSSPSSSSASSTPEPQLPQKRKLAEAVKAEEDDDGSSDDSSSSPNDSGSESDSDDGSDASDSDSEDSDSESDTPTSKTKSRATTVKAKAADGGEEDEAPVLSHADLRRQKKKAKLEAKAAAAEAAEDGSAPKKRKLENGKAAVDQPTKRQNSVWVGNMSFKTTQDDLRGFFKEAGEVTRINMPTKPSGRPGGSIENKGYAYVDFATPEAKAAAIALSEHPLIGRKLLIKDGDDFAGRPAPPGQDPTQLTAKTHSKTARRILNSQKQPPAPTLFVGNLSFETTVEDLQQMFESHRPAKDKAKKPEVKTESGAEPPKPWLRKVRMATFEDTGKCKGFAFIDFGTKEYAEEALINPRNHHLNGRDLQVEFASAEAVRRGAPRQPAEKDVDGRPARPHKGKSAGYDRTKPKNPGSNKAAQKEASALKREKSGKPSKEEKKRRRKEAAGLLGNRGRDREGGGEGGEEQEEKTEGGKWDRKADRGRPTRPMRHGRQKPGAALAGAPRQSAAILPSQGKKMTF